MRGGGGRGREKGEEDGNTHIVRANDKHPETFTQSTAPPDSEGFSVRLPSVKTSACLPTHFLTWWVCMWRTEHMTYTSSVRMTTTKFTRSTAPSDNQGFRVRLPSVKVVVCQRISDVVDMEENKKTYGTHKHPRGSDDDIKSRD